MITVTMPKLADSTDDYVIAEISVNVGDRVSPGDVLATVETDKVLADVPSEVSGRIVEILVAPDDEVSTGSALIVIDQDA